MDTPECVQGLRIALRSVSQREMMISVVELLSELEKSDQHRWMKSEVKFLTLKRSLNQRH